MMWRLLTTLLGARQYPMYEQKPLKRQVSSGGVEEEKERAERF